LLLKRQFSNASAISWREQVNPDFLWKLTLILCGWRNQGYHEKTIAHFKMLKTGLPGEKNQ
jgi:hypothetical protein